MQTVMLRRLARLLVIFLCGTAVTDTQAQLYILGRILDDEEVPYAYAKASLRGDDYYTEQTCTELGVFRFENLKAGKYELVVITPYGIRRRKVELRGSLDITLHVARNIRMDEVSVVATKASSEEPVTHDNITAAEIDRLDFGKDMPFILQHSPSVVATSDAGNGIGYSGLRIRGSDPTRINVTMNGIPVNDAESHNMFWVDLPDLASGATDIQIQRGIGWSQPGVGDLGGSVNVNTLGFKSEPYLGIKLGAGSFNTSRQTIAGGTGLLKGRFTLDNRISFASSDGYIDRAKSKLSAVSVTAGYHQDATNIRLYTAFGKELTYQAWNGVPAQYINDDELRTYNTAGTERDSIPHDNEVDDYKQNHIQLHLDQAITPFARFTGALHYTRGKGFFEQYKADQLYTDYGLATDINADLIRRRWLDNHFYGFTSVLHFGRPEKRYFLLGGGWTRYDGRHFGEVHWTAVELPDAGNTRPYYDNDADKRDGNIFARSNMAMGSKFDITVDLQARWIKYTFEGLDANNIRLDQTVKHRFFNPKLGLRYRLSDKGMLYAITGLNHKEPNRDDYTESTPSSRPSAERLWDTEIGYRHQAKAWRTEVNGYFMQYKDQLTLTGRLNDVGAYTRVNVPDSYRAGIELYSSVNVTSRLTLDGNLTISANKVKAFDEYIDDWATGNQLVVSHENTDIAFSPNTIAAINGSFDILSNQKHTLTLALHNRHVGEQYVDNTSRDASLLNAYWVSDASLRWRVSTNRFKEISLALLLNNLFDSAYESNGWIYRFASGEFDPTLSDPYAERESGDLFHQKGYFPQAGRNIMVQFSLNF
jgi:iron complex outermembrane receptor protein